jgi:hypothetical protein
MDLFHAVVWIDHQAARLLQFDAEQVQAQEARSRVHRTAQHGSAVRTRHECSGVSPDRLEGIAGARAAGSPAPIADPRHLSRCTPMVRRPPRRQSAPNEVRTREA